MIILQILEYLAVAILVLLVVTQVVIPLIFGGRTWWLFRSSTKALAEKQDALNELKTEQQAVKMDKEVQRVRQKLDKEKTPTKEEA
jgi:cell division protein FtsB